MKRNGPYLKKRNLLVFHKEVPSHEKLWELHRCVCPLCSPHDVQDSGDLILFLVLPQKTMKDSNLRSRGEKYQTMKAWYVTDPTLALWFTWVHSGKHCLKKTPWSPLKRISGWKNMMPGTGDPWNRWGRNWCHPCSCLVLWVPQVTKMMKWLWLLEKATLLRRSRGLNDREKQILSFEKPGHCYQ